MWPTLRALKVLGGSAHIGEIEDRIATDLALGEEVLDVLHGGGPQTEFANRCGFARTNLKAIDAIVNSAWGVWAITEAGRRIESDAETRKKFQRWQSARNKRVSPLASPQRAVRARRPARTAVDVQEQPTDEPDTGDSWQADLLNTLRGIEPARFERLCQRLLREHGFTSVEVTGRSGDGGIDGTGVLRVNLLWFRVAYQCKRYAGNVAPKSIRDFRGAVTGRVDKGIFITTGRFTESAKQEAVRDGAMTIDLIDGEDLCELLREKGLGVHTETVEQVTHSRKFFESL